MHVVLKKKKKKKKTLSPLSGQIIYYEDHENVVL